MFLFLVAMTTATFAGTGLTVIMQGRVVTVEVVDNCLYNITVLNENKRFINTNSINRNSGTLMVNVPQGNDYIDVVVTNIYTGATEIITLRVE